MYLYTTDIQDFDLEVYELEDGCGEYAAICRKNNFYSFGYEEKLVKEFKEFLDKKLVEQNRIDSLEGKVLELVEEVAYLKRKLEEVEANETGAFPVLSTSSN